MLMTQLTSCVFNDLRVIHLMWYSLTACSTRVCHSKHLKEKALPQFLRFLTLFLLSPLESIAQFCQKSGLLTESECDCLCEEEEEEEIRI